MGWLRDKLFALVSALLDWFGAFFHGVIEWVVEVGKAIIFQVWMWSLDNMPPEFIEWVTAFDWTVLAQLMQDAAWIFPIVPVLGIITVRYSITAYILVIRWIIHVFPTVGG